jgi:two-component system, OmpR family, response regulator
VRKRRVNRDGRPRVLAVDPEPSITAVVTSALRHEGFNTREALTGRAAEDVVDEFHPDLIVLDLVLLDSDGLEVAAQIRAGHPRTRVIFLTEKGSPEDRLAGLAVGDDYVTKPFSVEELVARVRAVLRPTVGAGDAALAFGDLVLNQEAHEVRRGGQLLDLSPTEFALLRLFMLNPNRVLSKQQIIDQLWGYDSGTEARLVETYVCYLRKKLNPLGPPVIQTIRLVGYVLRESER